MKATALLVLAAQIFFLWMFLAAEPLEGLADAGLISGPAQGGDIHAATYLFAARWRHGMTAGWPLYMPGFFSVAITVWFWALGLGVRQILTEGAVLTLLAVLTALALQPIGTRLIVDEFHQQTGLKTLAEPPRNTALGIFRSIYTMATFGTGITCIQRAIEFRKAIGLLLPIVMNIILAVVRPWTVADFTSHWFRSALNGDVVAIASFLAVAMTAALMFWSLRITVSRSRKASGATLAGARPKQGINMSE
jgi:hypothetical protein